MSEKELLNQLIESQREILTEIKELRREIAELRAEFRQTADATAYLARDVLLLKNKIR